MVVGQHERARARTAATTAPDASPPAPPFAAAGIKTRILSIDAFRGFVMFLMLAEAMHLMNVRRAFPGNRFWEFVAFNTTHVPWQGCSLHDLIQPAFSFLVGAAMAFSIASRTSRGESWNRMLAARDVAQRRAHLPRDLPALAEQRPDILDVRGHAHADRPRLYLPLSSGLHLAARPDRGLRCDPRRLLGRRSCSIRCRRKASTTRRWACGPTGRISTRASSPTSTRTRTCRGRSTSGSSTCSRAPSRSSTTAAAGPR